MCSGPGWLINCLLNPCAITQNEMWKETEEYYCINVDHLRYIRVVFESVKLLMVNLSFKSYI